MLQLMSVIAKNAEQIDAKLRQVMAELDMKKVLMSVLKCLELKMRFIQ